MKEVAMHAHIVLAHPEPQSYNAHLASKARDALEAQGWSVSISDLYQLDFDPCERASHYAERVTPQRFDVQSEQRNAMQGRSRDRNGRSIPDPTARFRKCNIAGSATARP
jgi:hypothetical protein